MPAAMTDAPKVLDSFDLEGIAKVIKERKARRIVCLCGAGISVSAGIPDFRSPDTGLYSQLAKMDITVPKPEDVFRLGYFKEHPKPFHVLAKMLYPGTHKPTLVHYFMALLEREGILLRCFTQNIDGLETIAGLPKDKVVYAHGNFDTASCINTKCKKQHDPEWVKETILAGKICECQCKGYVKPGIIFFDESTTREFHTRQREDLPKCDLLIVMGTSLAVNPFADLLCKVSSSTPRLLINRAVVGVAKEDGRRISPRTSLGFQFTEGVNYRDALFLGDCDEGVLQLADLLGWRQDLMDLLQQGHQELDRAKGVEEPEVVDLMQE